MYTVDDDGVSNGSSLPIRATVATPATLNAVPTGDQGDSQDKYNSGQ